MSSPSDSSSPIGLIAGQGKLPLLVAEGMKAAGRRIIGVGLRGQFSPELPAKCDCFAEAGVVQPGKWIRFLHRHRAAEAIMVGRVAKARMHDPWRLVRQIPDWTAIMLWYRRLRHDRRNAVLLAAVADELARNGIQLVDSTRFIPDHMAGPGVNGGVSPSASAQADIEFGWPLIQRMVELHIGQSMAVREGDVIAVEAVEGTDLMIERAGSLCRARGWSLLKTSARHHDRRADVPTIGVETIERLAKAGGRAVAVGVNRVILLDRPAVIEAADRLGIAIVGMPDA